MRVQALILTGLMAVGCGGGGATIGGGGTGGSGAGTGAGTTGTGGGVAGTGGGIANNCKDDDHDGVTTCASDCNDADANVKPGGVETVNQIDDDCDGKIDNHVLMADFDHDGSKYGETDCNDDEPLVGPFAIEDPANMVDDNCDGQIDEAVPLCEGTLTGGQASDYAKAIGLCGFVTGSNFMAGNANARGIRNGFGDQFMPKAGTQMAMLSTGTAKDNKEAATYNPQPGFEFNTMTAHPLWAKPKCGNPSQPMAEDLSEISFDIQVPQNAKSFSFQFAFFSAEYPEFICTDFNDRFIAILESSALDPTKLPVGQCKTGTARPTCNVSYDSTGQPVTINNGFFDVCESYTGPNADGVMVTNNCTKAATMLAKTGYDRNDSIVGNKVGDNTK